MRGLSLLDLRLITPGHISSSKEWSAANGNGGDARLRTNCPSSTYSRLLPFVTNWQGCRPPPMHPGQHRRVALAAIQHWRLRGCGAHLRTAGEQWAILPIPVRLVAGAARTSAGMR